MFDRVVLHGLGALQDARPGAGIRLKLKGPALMSLQPRTSWTKIRKELDEAQHTIFDSLCFKFILTARCFKARAQLELELNLWQRRKLKARKMAPFQPYVDALGALLASAAFEVERIHDIV